MNIWQLKEYIKDLPDDMLVLRNWYEWWYDTLVEPKEIQVYHQPNASRYYGRYDDYKDWKTLINAYLF